LPSPSSVALRFVEHAPDSSEIFKLFHAGSPEAHDASDRGSAVMDIFRVNKGLIVEHWDVEQAVPAEPKNRNTMF
jgi:predicted SnoaL-like aldol condensation-catalyzing enzyme